MADFTPVNSLEINLRALLRDKRTPIWSFYTPLAAAPLWFITQRHPELDGSDLVAPKGQNPEVCVFESSEHSCIGIYTARCRVEEIFKQWEISQGQFIYVAAPGYQVLRFLSQCKADHLFINAGLQGCQLQLDPDLMEILLSRPEPPPKGASKRQVVLDPNDDAPKFLGPLKEFLGRQPRVRAAWIFVAQSDAPRPSAPRAYEIGLVMEDPEDESLLHEVGVMAKALTPVEMEWTPTLLIADDQSLRNMAKQQRPFYESPQFLKK